MAGWIRKMGAPHWLMLFAGILVAWAALYAMAIPAEMRALSRIYGAEFWASLCVVTPDAAGFFRIWAMWVLMSAAMMAPTALPAFAVYDDLSRNDETASFARLVAGYGVIWIGFSLIAAGAQMALFLSGVLSPLGQSLSPLFSAAILVLAGLYQFSNLKEACLSQCQAPFQFFLGHWDEGPWRNGVRLGVVCLGCCWALMALAFVGGVMNLAFMALATILMTLEKLPEIGARITRPLGWALIAGAAAMLAYGLT